MNRKGGFTALELVVALAVFTIFIIVLAGVEREMIRYDRSVGTTFLQHPLPAAVMARVRRDVLDSNGYPVAIGSYKQTPSTLILTCTSDAGASETVVYDFSEDGVARRLSFEGATETSEWVANQVPKFVVSEFDMPDGAIAVRVEAYQNGTLSIDSIVLPRVRT